MISNSGSCYRKGVPAEILLLGSEDVEGPGRNPPAVILRYGGGFLVYHTKDEALGIFVGFDKHWITFFASIQCISGRPSIVANWQ